MNECIHEKRIEFAKAQFLVRRSPASFTNVRHKICQMNECVPVTTNEYIQLHIRR